MPLTRVGLLTGTVLPAVNLVMALMAGGLAARFGTVRLVVLGGAGVLAAGGLMAAACLLRSEGLAVAPRSSTSSSAASSGCRCST